MISADRYYMDVALRLGRRNRGATGENPSVGCVLVAGESGARHIVGRGWTERGGRPHAETVALSRAGAAARGATAYVTLEPCAHHGQTPPCAQALADAGIARLVAAIQDPDPRVAGAGFTMLREAGVTVEIGLLAPAARRDLSGFLSRIERDRPCVTLKLAVSSDGKISERPGATSQITGPAARAMVHLIRTRCDAILVGKNTVLVDDPQLTCRLPGLSDRSPVRVVLDSALESPVASKIVRHANSPAVVIYCAEPAPVANMKALQRAGAVVVPVRTDGDRRPALPAVLGDLARRGINDLMVEGGARVATRFLNADLVDRIALFVSPNAAGHGGVDALEGLPLEHITDQTRFDRVSSRAVGEDVLDWYVRKE